MRTTAYLAVAAILAALALTGCGSAKVEGVPATVAVVDGRGISSAAYLSELHRKTGRDTLHNMIQQQGIIAWAEKEKVPVTQKQIDEQIDILKRDGAYEDNVKTLGEKGLRFEIEAGQARANLARKFYDFSDEELQGIYDAMKQFYVHGPRKQVALIISSDKKKVQKAEKALKKNMDFDEASAKYADRQFTSRGTLKTWIADDDAQMPSPLVKAAKETKKGETSKLFSFVLQPGMPTNYAILKVVDTQAKANRKFKDVKEEVENSAARQKSYMDPDFQERLTERMKEADIKVNVGQYKGIEEEFKNPPEPEPFPSMGRPQRVPKAAPKEKPSEPDKEPAKAEKKPAESEE